MRVVIVDNSRGEVCDAGCGADWSSAEVIALARQRVRDSFGEGVQLEYLDLAGQPHNAAELKRIVGDRALPLLVIDGQARIAGQFDLRQLLDAISTEAEIKSQNSV
ncbi:MAG: hypothetical protein HY530_05650 [Chloroflexi bacterium]|nr:hypothetical protein [Chloroflexota bacterium]